MKKILFSILAAAFIFTGAVTYARACSLPMAELSTALSENPELKLVDLTEQQAKTFVENAGAPPNADPGRPYTMRFIVYPNGLARLLVVQDDCVTDSAGPAPLEVFLRKAGIVEANG